jgi:tRNA1Val (adenine37-N6)-methyltransferase
MKVGTDAVLLGAWVSNHKPVSILDIGTGCGLIALMLAQRFDSARINAIDIDENSIQEAAFNFNTSPWAHRLNAQCVALQNWEAAPYDLIVSNPPYFAHSFPIAQKSRAVARTQQELDFKTLVVHAKRLLKPEGRLAVVLPARARTAFEEQLTSEKLFCNRITYVLPSTEKAAVLILVEASNKVTPLVADSISIRTATGYHQDYLALTRDFYLFS